MVPFIKHESPMWCFLQAGMVAAGRQLGAIIILTFLLVSVYPYLDQNAATGGVEALCNTGSQLLKWAYLLLAIAVAATSTRSVDLSARWIGYASRLIKEPRRLIYQFGLSAFLFAAFALRMPPELMIDVGSSFGCVGAASFVWAGAMSIGVASFGASTHAALLELVSCGSIVGTSRFECCVLRGPIGSD